jgi:hypothetical protein
MKDSFIRITNTQVLIEELIHEMILEPRIRAIHWSKITNQTPNIKIGYPGQHLASLITGVRGLRTGARGDDLEDGTEVKSCSRIDQVDTCRSCKQKVARVENNCSFCGSLDINRKDDSKWLFSVKSEEELELLTKTVNRVFLTLADYPNFSHGDFDTIRIQAFELWNNSIRHKRFGEIMDNYYHKIFLEHIKLNPKKTPAPKNFWPFSYQFYLCNPVRVFSCTIINANSNPQLKISHYIEPSVERADIRSEQMMTDLLTDSEIKILLNDAPDNLIINNLMEPYNLVNLRNLITNSKINREDLRSILPFIDEDLRAYLSLRDTDKISVAKEKYTR